MKTMMKIKNFTSLKTLGLASLLALTSVSCSKYAANPELIREEAKDNAKKMLFERGISAKEWERLEQEAKESYKDEFWGLNGAVEGRNFWDSVKIKSMVDEAYYKGAQSVRDSIKYSGK